MTYDLKSLYLGETWRDSQNSTYLRKFHSLAFRWAIEVKNRSCSKKGFEPLKNSCFLDIFGNFSKIFQNFEIFFWIFWKYSWMPKNHENFFLVGQKFLQLWPRTDLTPNRGSKSKNGHNSAKIGRNPKKFLQWFPITMWVSLRYLAHKNSIFDIYT